MHAPAGRLWSGPGLVVLAGGATVASAGLVGAWVGASGTTSVEAQVHWLEVGIAAVTTSGASAAIWLLTLHRAVRRRTLLSLGPLRAETSQHAAVPRHDELVAVRAGRHHHRPQCALVRGKDVVAASQHEHAADGCTPCGVCRP
jgi:hypothetical protein